ncbi:GGDEF domain-containing protein [Thalassotalea fusca]
MQDYKTQRLIGISLYIASVILIISAAALALMDIKHRTALGMRDSLHTVLQTVQEAQHLVIQERKSTLDAIVAAPEIVNQTQQLIKAFDNQVAFEQYHPIAMSLFDIVSGMLKRYDNRDFFLISVERINISSNQFDQIGKRSIIDQLAATQLDAAFKDDNYIIKGIKTPDPSSKKFVPAMFITATIKDKQENVIALLAKFVDPKTQFSNISELGRIGESGETYAFDRSGLLLTESRFKHHLESTNQISLGEDSMMNIYITDPGGNLLEGHQPTTNNELRPLTKMAEQAVRGLSGHDVTGYRDYRGVEVFGSWLWDSTLSMGLATEINKDEALTSYIQTRNIFISVIVFTLVVGYVVLRVIFSLLNKSAQQMQDDKHLLAAKVAERTQELLDAQDELSRANKELQILAITDGLTKLANRRRFDQVFAEQWQRSLRQRTSIAIIMLDVDSFKQYNDNFGHQKGDQCLEKIAAQLTYCQIARRPGDILARYGGEEFVVLLCDTSYDYAVEVAEKIRFSIEALAIPHRFSTVADKTVVTGSIGLRFIDNVSTTRQALALEQADKALYQAKIQGRNQVQVYKEEPLDNVRPIKKQQT